MQEHNFKEGDNVKIIHNGQGNMDNCQCLGMVGKVKYISEAYATVKFPLHKWTQAIDLRGCVLYPTQYEQLKSDILALGNGYDKTADDILIKINAPYAIVVPTHLGGNVIFVYCSGKAPYPPVTGAHHYRILAYWAVYDGQEQKLEALKSCIGWILDNSNIKKNDARQQQIENLELEKKAIQDKIESLR